MKLYEVVGPVARFPVGFVLGLRPEQAKARAHRLRKTDDGYEVVEPVEFKRGEVVHVIAGDVGKGRLIRAVEGGRETGQVSSDEIPPAKEEEVEVPSVPLRRNVKVPP